ncbi:MFS general substrate transporter [Lophiostoma macrostomum CBS 122681]|uniref:MFS general substrate transporter n=1 Tax=Lophiostoma macrostomum CBS 122681 TaxID=1314788 RepID=A0A6A6SLR1_9PLEO|nr:MFS general substrate transporter [Lophiostoma macrostomum CBS 122681]
MDNGEWQYEWTIPAIWLSLWSGIGPIGQIAGSALGGYLLDRKGRKFCLGLGSLIGAIGILDLVLSNLPGDKNARRGMILAGKIIQGFGLGLIKIETFTYMSEVIPVSLKGAVMSFVPTFTLLGQLIGSIVIFAVIDNEKSMAYMIAMGSQWALALPPFILAFYIPESPAFLIKHSNPHGALQSFTRLLGPKNNPRAALRKMEITIEEEARMSAKVSYADCFNSINRRRTLIVIFASCVEFCFGLSLLSDVSYFLQRVGMDSSKSVLFLIAGVVCGLFANFAATWTVSHIGRRKLTVTSFIVVAGLWAFMGFLGFKTFSWTPWAVGGICTAVVVSAGLGCWPASYAILGETSALRVRAKSQALGSLANNITGIIANFTLPFLYNNDAANIGAKTGFVFTAFSALGAVLTYFFVPELKGRSALEIDHLFEKGVKSIGSSKLTIASQNPGQ